MIEPNEIYSSVQVAVLVFGVSARTFYARRSALDREGFPRPISTRGRPRWLGEDLLAWMGRDKSRPAGGRGTRGPNIIDLHERALVVAAGTRNSAPVESL